VSTVRDYLSLLKLRVVVLLDATAVGVMIPAAHGHPAWPAVVAVLVGGTFAAGGAHAINCWFDRDIDGEMNRTRSRPLPNGRIPAWHALVIGIALNVVAFAVLWLGANLLAASLALPGALIYVFVYTMWLKRSTPRTSSSEDRPARSRHSSGGPRRPGDWMSPRCHFSRSSSSGRPRISGHSRS